MPPPKLTPAERDAVLALLPEPPADTDDLFRALNRAIDRALRDSPRVRALAIQACRHNDISWPAMQRRTGVAQSTLRSWLNVETDQ